MHDNSLTLGNRRWAKGLWALGRSRVVLGHRAEVKPSSQQERARLANRWIVACMWTEHFSASGIGKARWVVEPRSEPDSGKPTVRDRRGAWRNVAMVELGNPLRNRKGGAGNPPPKVDALQLYPRPGIGITKAVWDIQRSNAREDAAWRPARTAKRPRARPPATPFSFSA